VHRQRPLCRLTVWVFAGLLLAKSAVPLFASAAAQLHGKGVADVCPLHGVALPVAQASDPHAAHQHHASHAGDDGAAKHAAAADGPGDGPVRHDARGGDHCVLTALAIFAADRAVATQAPPPRARSLRVVASRDLPPVADASARWAARLGHGPPRLS
jgi:hypothetical protein